MFCTLKYFSLHFFLSVNIIQTLKDTYKQLWLLNIFVISNLNYSHQLPSAPNTQCNQRKLFTCGHLSCQLFKGSLKKNSINFKIDEIQEPLLFIVIPSGFLLNAYIRHKPLFFFRGIRQMLPAWVFGVFPQSVMLL